MTISRPGQPGRTPADQLRAVVVEDEAPLARVIADYFVKDGFDVDIAGDGETWSWCPGPDPTSSYST